MRPRRDNPGLDQHLRPSTRAGYLTKAEWPSALDSFVGVPDPGSFYISCLRRAQWHKGEFAAAATNIAASSAGATLVVSGCHIEGSQAVWTHILCSILSSASYANSPSLGRTMSRFHVHMNMHLSQPYKLRHAINVPVPCSGFHSHQPHHTSLICKAPRQSRQGLVTEQAYLPVTIHPHTFLLKPNEVPIQRTDINPILSKWLESRSSTCSCPALDTRGASKRWRPGPAGHPGAR